MPNAPLTPNRTFRIPDEVWFDVQKLAKDKGVTVTSIVVELLREYIAKNKVVYGDWQ